MDLDGIAAFVKVVQAGSFSLAARQLGIPNTTVSARVARLEKRLGVTLIQRTTRRLHVTPAGRACFERCVRGLEEIQSAEAEVTHAAAEPQGLLRITAPGDVAHGLLPPLVSRYLELYPRTSVEILVTNRVVDLVAEGVHLAIRASALGDSTLIARKFMSFKGGLWASRDYLERRGAPKKPADLEQHECVLFPRLRGRPLPLTDGKRRLEVPVHGRLVADDMESLRKLAVQGIGVATLPDFLALDGDGALARVLPSWTWMTGALSFVYPGQRFVPANVRAFIDMALTFRSSSAD